MPLLKDGKITEDQWTHVSDDDATPSAGAIVVSFDRWTEDKEALISRTEPLGIRLTADQSPELIEGSLNQLSLVELEFPAFTNGRAYSYAQLLLRAGFTGEIRAVGNVLRDQYGFMKRCGFNALEIKQGETEADWETAVSAFTAPYQVAHDEIEPIMSLRERRLAARKAVA